MPQECSALWQQYITEYRKVDNANENTDNFDPIEAQPVNVIYYRPKGPLAAHLWIELLTEARSYGLVTFDPDEEELLVLRDSETVEEIVSRVWCYCRDTMPDVRKIKRAEEAVAAAEFELEQAKLILKYKRYTVQLKADSDIILRTRQLAEAKQQLDLLLAWKQEIEETLKNLEAKYPEEFAREKKLYA